MTRRLRALAGLLLVPAVFAAPARADVLVANYVAGSIERFTDTGTYLGPFVSSTLAATYGLSLPSGLAYNSGDGLVYVASQGSNQIMRFNALTGLPAGLTPGSPVFINNMNAINDPVHPIPAGIPYAPTTLRFSPTTGDLYVSRFLNFFNNPGPTVGQGTADRFNPTTGAFVGSVMAGFSGTTGLAFKPDGTLLAASFSSPAGGGYVDKLVGTTQSNMVAMFSGGLQTPGGLTLNGNDLYVVDVVGGTVHHYDATGPTATALADLIAIPGGNPGSLIGQNPSELLFVNGLAWVTATGPDFNPTGALNRYTTNGTTATYLDTIPFVGGWNPSSMAIVPSVPEPGTLGLAGIAAAAFAAWRRKRRS